ncbi:MAG: phosphatidylglycerophosphatase A [Magnetococcus sp. WYHC-3]
MNVLAPTPTLAPLDRLAVGLATLGVIGRRAPVAPGTLGSLAALPLCALLWGLPLWGQGMLVAAAYVLGVWASGRAARVLGEADPAAVVIDEVAGMLFITLFMPVSLDGLLVGFFLFRLFDILKPWPVSWLERRLPGGWGIMTDDMAAALLGGLVLQGLLRLVPALPGMA